MEKKSYEQIDFGDLFARAFLSLMGFIVVRLMFMIIKMLSGDWTMSLSWSSADNMIIYLLIFILIQTVVTKNE